MQKGKIFLVGAGCGRYDLITLRGSAQLRRMVRETHISKSDLIYPIFIAEGNGIKKPVESMPGVFQYSLDTADKMLEQAYNSGISGLLIFGIPAHKDELATSAYDDNGVTQTAVRYIKAKYPDLLVIADVCLCEYTSHGHCGVVHGAKILNDETLPLLAKMSVSLAKAGADIIAPSDMMDGRVAAIRAALDENGFADTPIMSYSAKFASGYYSPFRDAAESAPCFGDRKTYQMDPANGREALREIADDIGEGAGVTQGFVKDTLLAQYNSEASVEALFKQFPQEIACVIVEPCAANMGVVPPKSGFLKFLREITQKHGALLIFDEVITGFRLSIGGAQKLFGVTPDLTTLGKIVGGGMPLAVYGGRKEIMECVAPLGSVYQAGTLSGNPCAVAAGTAMLKQLESISDLYEALDRKAHKLEQAMKSAGLNVNRCGSLLTAFFTDKTVVSYREARGCDTEKYAAYYRYLLNGGIYTAPSQFEAMFVSYAHSDEDIERTAELIQTFKK